ncbi:spheroidene monooxygenase [Yoonia sp. SS1-5]|uniref:Spheroidene monooxygenase n=1 Tax=Yoonia rhodophyticola TaxID=3137370 RepID=A0AAN0MGY8_9RHOB
MTQIVTLSFFRFSGFSARAWALMMMGAGRLPLSRTPDIGFWKLCGSGTGYGFSPTLNPSVIAILAVWPDASTAQDRIENAPIFARYRKRAVETWSVLLTPTSVRGEWDGQVPFTQQADQATGPMAALTRAAIRRKIIPRFWRQVPDISRMIGTDADVAFKIGIGELPLIDQITFSIWPTKSAMDAFARTGPHGDAIKAVRAGDWFKEELFARFAVHSDSGTWNGTSPLKNLEAA